ncbi:MAG: aminomethyltransferase, partial [Gammaproteobacteria bacterium]|nr:aminomethyltransferase [Gammaproteobacteria bacterium]
GIAQGAGCGKYLAQWMVHGDAEINMTGFDPRRFGGFADKEYMRAKGFQDYGMTYFTPLPGEELPAARECRKSPLYGSLKAKGCVFTQTFGWERPKWFSPDGREEECGYRRNNVFDVVRAECTAVAERAGVLDLSGFAKYDVSGAGARAFLDRLCANRIPGKDGGIVLTHLLSPLGRINAEVTVTRLAEDRYYLLSAASAELRDLDFLVQGVREGEVVAIENVTDERGVLVLAGPKSRDVLAAITDTPLGNAHFPWLTGKEITVAGAQLRALRVNYVGELGWELHPAMADLETVYAAVWQAGQAHGIADFGLYAVNSLRIEKAYRGFGAELTNEVTLPEADMERFLKLDKGDFNGREATLASMRGDSKLRLVYFEVDVTDNEVRGGEPIFSGGSCVGVTTSGGYGYRVAKSLGFGYVPPALASAGTRLEIGLLGESRNAVVLAEPAYDPSNKRLRA